MATRRRLILGFFIGMIGLSVTSLSLSLAWYASSNFLQVSPVDIKIQSDRLLMLSTTPNKEDFKESLSLEDGDLAFNGPFTPVSSIRSEDWISTRADTPKFYDCSNPWNLSTNPAMDEIGPNESYYYSQELYLYADDSVYVTIDTEKSFIDTDDVANSQYAQHLKNSNPDLNLTTDEIKEKLDLLTKAMRFSILVTGDDYYKYYVIDPNKAENDEEVLFGGVLDNSNTEYYDTYRDGEEFYETVYGDVNDRSLIEHADVAELADSEVVGEYSAFNAKHQKGTHRFDYQASYEKGMRFATEDSISYSELAENPELIKFPVQKGFQNARRIVLSIYIEGWDLRSINSTMGSAFVANLSFKIYREMV